MIKKKKRTWKLVVSLMFVSLVLAVSVCGLSIISGVNASENTGGLDTNLDVIEESKLAALDYVTGNSGSTAKKEVVKIDSVEKAIAVANNFLDNKAYVVTSNGKLGVAGTIDGLLNQQTICDLSYYDYFEHEASGRAYWEEGFKVTKFYNSVIESMFNAFSTATDFHMEQLSRDYFIDKETLYTQWISDPEFTNGFKASQKAINNSPINKEKNTDVLKELGYANRYFRWDINNNTVKNGVVSKLISGYQFEFDLDVEKGARDVYYRWVRWLPSNVFSNAYPGAYHYVINFDNYGNIVSFARNEAINMEISAAITGNAQLVFTFKYAFKTKADDYKITLDNVFKTALSQAGY